LTKLKIKFILSQALLSHVFWKRKRRKTMQYKYDVSVGGLSIDALIKEVGGLEGARALMRGELKIVPVCNEHGHIVLTVVGLDLTGEREIQRLTAAGFRLTDWAKSRLQSTKYDKEHRLADGVRYKIALMPTREITRDSDRTTDALRNRGIELYGYGKPLAGITPRIRESVSDKQMEKMGFSYIAVPHDPIKDSDGTPGVLNADRYDVGRGLGAFWDCPDFRWYDDGAFAFLDPTS
jgi:hypothetical protein